MTNETNPAQPQHGGRNASGLAAHTSTPAQPASSGGQAAKTPKTNRPTMNDVAASAGVSLKTVSRVVNGSDHVKPDKEQRVRAAIELLGFRRNESARQLRQGTTNTIGLVLEDVADPFYSSLTRAVEDITLGHGNLLLAASSAEDPRRAEGLITAFLSRGVDGLIVTPAEGMSLSFLRAEIADGCSMVLVDRPVRGLDVDTVTVDNRGGTRLGVNRLVEHGHSRIAFFGDIEAVFTASERRNGYLEALDEAAIPVDNRLIVMAAPTQTSIDDVLNGLFALDDPPTAFFSGNNRWSVQLLRGLRNRIQDLGFIGFDDFELGDVLDPGITVIAQDPAAMGRIAADLLYRRIEGDNSPPQRIQLGTTLIERGSGEVRAR